MKSLSEYSKEKIILEEGGIKNFLKKAWDWLIGKRAEEYNPSSRKYNEKSKIKYINQYSSKEIKIKEVPDSKVLLEIVKKSLSKNDEKVGFFKLNSFFKSHPNYKNISDDNHFISLYFQSENLSESCGLIGYSSKYKGFEGENTVYIAEFLSIYKYLIDYEEVAKELKSIDENMNILNPYLISQLTKNEIGLNKVEGKKDVYTIE